MGYYNGGFARVVGVDLNDDCRDRYKRPRPRPLKRYPFPSIEMDALQALEELLRGGYLITDIPGGGHGEVTLADFAAIHASPPCQLFSRMTKVNGRRRDGTPHVDLITPMRPLLEETGLPYVIENVPEAAAAGVMRADLMLCGSMFDPPLDVQRHRVFEANWPIRETDWPCRHGLWGKGRFKQRDYRKNRGDYSMRVVPVYGGTRFAGDAAIRRRAMEIDWMTLAGLNEAIPPRYGEFIGAQLLQHIESERAA
jgi:DNA (cytosine-5)-methyltransferase 1